MGENTEQKEKVLVLGASTNPSRYSFKAIQMLKEFGHTVLPLGRGEGSVADIAFLDAFPEEGVDTVTMYLAPRHQEAYQDQILALRPKRVIFNPGAENATLYSSLTEAGIQIEEACTLVLLRTGQF